MNAIPDPTASLLQQAVAALHRGDLNESRRLAQEIITTHPDDFDAHHLLAVLALQEGDLEQGERHYQHALALRPEDPQILNGLGAIALYRRHIEQAEGFFRRALNRHPDHPEAALNLAGLLLDLGRTPEALPLLDSLATLAPRPAVFAQRGRANWQEGNLEQAREDYQRAVSEDPHQYRAWLGLGVTAIELNDLSTAQTALERARTAPDGDISTKATFNLAHLHYRMGRYAEAAELFQATAPTLPEGRFGLAMTQLLMGNFREGWDNWRHRPSRQRPGPWSPPTPLPENTPPADLLIVHDEGPGDELFFLRFLPELQARGHRIRYLPSPPLAPLVQHLPGVEVLPCGGLPEPRPAEQVYLTGDLGALLQSGVTSSFPPPLRLEVDPRHWRAMEERLRTFGPPPYIGLTWRSGDEDEGRGRLLCKDAPAELIGEALAPFLQGHPATLVTLMRTPDPEGQTRLATAAGQKVHTLQTSDLGELLAALDLLDDYISVPSTNLHLRASLARPARVLVPHPPEWRWGMTSEVSPWFPHFRLYRADTEGWQNAGERLTTDLCQ